MPHLKYTIYGTTFVSSTAIHINNIVKSTMFIIQPRGIATDSLIGVFLHKDSCIGLPLREVYGFYGNSRGNMDLLKSFLKNLLNGWQTQRF